MTLEELNTLLRNYSHMLRGISSLSLFEEHQMKNLKQNKQPKFTQLFDRISKFILKEITNGIKYYCLQLQNITLN